MNILKILFSPSWGGLEILFAVYAEKFKEKGHNIICAIQPNPKLEKELYKNGIDFFTVKPVLKYLDFITAFKIRNLTRGKNIDIIHAYKSTDLSTAVLIKKIFKKPKLAFSQHMDSRYNKNDFFHKWIYRNIDRIYCLTESMKEHNLKYTPVSEEKLSVINNGINLERFNTEKDFDRNVFLKNKNLPPDKIIIGTIGRLDRLKNQALLIDAAKVLVEKYKNIHFVIVGDETKSITGINYKKELMDKIKAYKLENYFSIFGFSDEIEKYHSVFDIFVLTTPKETFGLVVIEAMATGKPVIASNRGGPAEIIENGENGFLFEPDDPDSLFKYLDELINNENLRELIGKKSIERVKMFFDLNKKVEEYLTSFESII